ncbi:hypothetical protein Cs7R123_32340 [Catellatospora sp. TT07R-123]|nr:hypothetical protein Cs7R123_32340 [Catellatospora sp. TT07R-123]
MVQPPLANLISYGSGGYPMAPGGGEAYRCCRMSTFVDYPCGWNAALPGEMAGEIAGDLALAQDAARPAR